MNDRPQSAELAPTATSDDAFPESAFSESPPSASVLSPARRLLRGRYRWAVGLGAAFASAGAVAGALLPKPVYKSVGLIDIAPKVPRVLYESDEKGLLPMFDAYVTSEAARASTRRVVDMAMASPEWKSLGRGVSDEEVAKFQEHLAVTHPKYTEHVEVAFTDEDPKAAATAVNQVIGAYMTIVAERENRSGVSTVKALENQRALASSELNRLRADTLTVTEDLGEQALAARYEAGIVQFNRLETALQDLDVDIALAKAAKEARPDEQSPPLTDDEIAVKDPGMQELLTQKAALDDKLNVLTDSDGFGSRHPDVVAARDARDALERRIAARADAYRRSLAAPPSDVVREKEARRARLAELREGVQTETKRLGKQRLALANLEQERSLQTERLDEVKRRLAQIDVESETHGRISVIALGDRPVEPDTDRRTPLAVLGAGGGVGLGFVVVMLWGLAESKLRHVVDVTVPGGGGRFLGVVPDAMEKVPGDADPAAACDFGVHQVRAMLQLRAGDKPHVVAFTSPSPGAGKTTLSLAIGMSYAAAGSRTLLVDLDFVGHGLTSTARSLVCEGAGRALRKRDADGAAAPQDGPRGIVSGLVDVRRLAFDDRQTKDLLERVRSAGSTGDASFARSADALEALSRRGAAPTSDGRRGVLGALDGRPIDDCVVETGFAGLDLLPVGDACASDAERIPRAALERMFQACRGAYDAVLVDMGPILGGIETTFAVAAADEVVLVLPRGERMLRVRDALTRLEEFGGRVVGLVFNRAKSADVAASSYASRPQSVGSAA